MAAIARVRLLKSNEILADNSYNNGFGPGELVTFAGRVGSNPTRRCIFPSCAFIMKKISC